MPATDIGNNHCEDSPDNEGEATLRQARKAGEPEAPGTGPKAQIAVQQARRLLDEERRRLEEVRNSLQQEALGETERESVQELSSVDQHTADLGTQTFQREKAESIRLSVEDRLADIEAAYHKLEKGGYGVCEECGRPIAKERLEARPETRFCAEDAARVGGGEGAASSTG